MRVKKLKNTPKKESVHLPDTTSTDYYNQTLHTVLPEPEGREDTAAEGDGREKIANYHVASPDHTNLAGASPAGEITYTVPSQSQYSQDDATDNAEGNSYDRGSPRPRKLRFNVIRTISIGTGSFVIGMCGFYLITKVWGIRGYRTDLMNKVLAGKAKVKDLNSKYTALNKAKTELDSEVLVVNEEMGLLKERLNKLGQSPQDQVHLNGPNNNPQEFSSGNLSPNVLQQLQRRFEFATAQLTKEQNLCLGFMNELTYSTDRLNRVVSFEQRWTESAGDDEDDGAVRLRWNFNKQSKSQIVQIEKAYLQKLVNSYLRIFSARLLHSRSTWVKVADPSTCTHDTEQEFIDAVNDVSEKEMKYFCVSYFLKHPLPKATYKLRDSKPRKEFTKNVQTEFAKAMCTWMREDTHKWIRAYKDFVNETKANES